MATTAASVSGRAGGRVGAPLPTRERRPGWVAFALLLVVGFAAAFGAVYQRAGEKTPVVMMVATVPAGHEIARADLSTVAVAGAVRAIAARDVTSVVGQRAAVTLLPGMPLQRSMISSSQTLPEGQALVGVAVKSGQMADALQPGDTVDVLQIPGAGSRSGQVDPAQVLVEAALVWSARPDPAQSGGLLVTLIVPHDASPTVASASGADLISLVKVAPR